MAFYKLDQDNNFHEAPNFVYAPDYTLLKDDHLTYEYPVDGWIWAESPEEAKQILGV